MSYYRLPNRRIAWKVFGFILTCVAAPLQAAAVELPAIRSGPGNEVPTCVRPARLMAFVREGSRRRDAGGRIDPRFVRLARAYRRIGRCVQKVDGRCAGVRWDFAFFQMLVETNYLTFRTPEGIPGSVAQQDNNFAGIGAGLPGQPAEKFADIATGVRAHLQHVLMYSGEKISAPVAQRTRAVEPYVLDRMRNLGRSPTFADLAIVWTGTDQETYGGDIEATAERFARQYCRRAAPRRGP